MSWMLCRWGGRLGRSAALLALGLFFLTAAGLAGCWWGGSPPTPTIEVVETPEESPIPSVPTATPTSADTPTPVRRVATFTPSLMPVALGVGGYAEVANTGGDPLNVRKSPGTNTDIVGTLALGTKVRIIGGPEEADNYTWWQVETVEGEQISGWVAAPWLKVSGE